MGEKVRLAFFCLRSRWVFPKIVVSPKWMVHNGKPSLKWMIWGYHYFRKHPGGGIKCCLSSPRSLGKWSNWRSHISNFGQAKIQENVFCWNGLFVWRLTLGPVRCRHLRLLGWLYEVWPQKTQFGKGSWPWGNQQNSHPFNPWNFSPWTYPNSLNALKWWVAGACLYNSIYIYI